MNEERFVLVGSKPARRRAGHASAGGRLKTDNRDAKENLSYLIRRLDEDEEFETEYSNATKGDEPWSACLALENNLKILYRDLHLISITPSH